jgi:hypothetical protein
MRVWVVLACDYEDVSVDSVWTTGEAARKYADEKNEAQKKRLFSIGGYYYSVDEVEADTAFGRIEK